MSINTDYHYNSVTTASSMNSVYYCHRNDTDYETSLGSLSVNSMDDYVEIEITKL